MNLQVLVATMNQEDYVLLEKMNIQTDAIVGNQCEINQVENFFWNGHRIKWLSFAERGVGLNRNNALMRADADLVAFADDDMVYVTGYYEVIKKTFQRLPDADIIIFGLGDSAQVFRTTKDIKVSWHNYMRYGAVRIVAKLNSIKLHGVYFNQCFGGGTEHGFGEDTLFLTSCLKAGLKIYAVPEIIANLTHERASTWFEGYTGKYMRDKGMLCRTISKHFWKLLCLQDAVRHSKLYKQKWYVAYKSMISKDGKNKLD